MPVEFGDFEDVADLFDPPADDPDALCPMCGPMPCRHSDEISDLSEDRENPDAQSPVR
jgi:hypothetical protein